MNSLLKRLDNIKKNLSGFKDEKDRQQAIRYLKSLDPDIEAKDVESIDDYFQILKSFFAPIPNTPEYENWIGTEMHAKYVKRQKAKQQEKSQVQV